MNPLFTDPFPAANKSAWLAQVAKDLKDPNAYESLRWPSPEGFTLEPYYTADDLTTLPLADVQAAQKQVPGWLNTPEIVDSDAKAVNEQARKVLSQGADSVILTGDALPSLSWLLNGIKLSDTPVFFRLTADPAAFVRALTTVAPYQLKGGLLTETSAATAEATRLTLDSPQFRTVCISSHAFHNAGATATQELAFALARLADAYDQLTDAGLTPEQLVPKTMLSVSVGTSYFGEIAKLRALRVLLDRFLNAYGQIPSLIKDTSPFIHAQTSTFYDATATPYTNLLRATTEALAAVIGGCDALTVHPYDTVLEAPTDFSARIARNVSVLLKEEGYLDKTADPAAGSYSVETLTHQLAEAAWALFLQVEQMGGLTKAFERGFVQTEIERSYRAKVEAVRNGRVLVGVTKFRFDEGETPKPDSYSKNLFGLGNLPDRRLAEEFE